MSAQMSIEQQFADVFNKTHGTNFLFSELEILSQVVIDNTFPPDYRIRNTVIVLGKDDMSVNIVYDRIPIANVLSVPEGLKLGLPKTADGTIHQLLPYINKRFGLDLLPIDIEVGQYVIDNALTSITLKSAKKSLRYLPGGSITIQVPAKYRVVNGKCELQPLTIDYKPSAFQVEADNYNGSYGAGRTHPSLITASFDYTPIAHILRAMGGIHERDNNQLLLSNYGNSAQFMAAIGSVDGLPWTYNTGAVPFNLYYTWVVYNGPTKDCKGGVLGSWIAENMDSWAMMDLINPDFDNVLVLRISTNTSNAKVGPAFLHYNDTLTKGRIDEHPQEPA